MRSYLVVAIGFPGLLLCSPARSEPVSPDPDSLVSAALDIDTGLALARRQNAETDLLGAVATVERVLIGHPDAIAARLLYATLLCRLDDAKGATAELAFLGSEKVPDEGWAELTAACGTMTRPSTEGTTP
jgi:hypothetical protein